MQFAKKTPSSLRKKNEKFGWMVESEKFVTNPLVSVCVPTFNHYKFIAQTLDSILQQKTSFPFEVLVGDDHSSDGTTDLILEYQQKNPDKIKIYGAKRNLRVAGGNNGIRLFEAARGKYIAITEGDDYWTDPLKLQTQFDYLENPLNSDKMACVHLAEVVDENGNQIGSFPVKKPGKIRDTYNIRQAFLESRSDFATASYFFRKFEFPDWFLMFYCDMHLELALLQKGDLGFIPRTMCAYRQHAGGVWSSKNFDKRADMMNRRFLYLKEIPEIREALGDTFMEVYLGFCAEMISSHKSKLKLWTWMYFLLQFYGLGSRYPAAFISVSRKHNLGKQMRKFLNVLKQCEGKAIFWFFIL